MKQHWHYLLALASFLLILALGLFAPGWLASQQEQKLLGTVQVRAFAPAEPGYIGTLSLFDTLRLASGQGQSIEVERGNQYTRDTIQQRCLEEVELLQKRELFPALKLEATDLHAVWAVLYIQADNPAYSAITWWLYYENEEATGNFVLDDEVGKVIAFSYQLNKPLEPLPDLETDPIVSSWVTYLGLEEQLVEIKPNAKIQEAIQHAEADGIVIPYIQQTDLFFTEQEQQLSYSITIQENSGFFGEVLTYTNTSVLDTAGYDY